MVSVENLLDAMDDLTDEVLDVKRELSEVKLMVQDIINKLSEDSE